MRSNETAPTNAHGIGSRLIIIGSIGASVLICVVLWIALATEFAPGGSPHNIAIAPNGKAFVTDGGRHGTILNPSGTSVWIIDTTTDRQTALLRARNTGNVVAISNNLVYLLSVHGNEIQVIDANAETVTASIPLLSAEELSSATDIRSLIELPTGDLLVSASTTLYRIDHQTRVTEYVRAFPNVVTDMLLVSARKLYVATYGQVWILDPQTFQVIGEIQRTAITHLRLISPTLAVAAHVVNFDYGITFINLADDTITMNLALDNIPIYGMVNTGDSKLYVLQGTGKWSDTTPSSSEQGVYRVAVIDLLKRQLLKVISLPPEPYLNDVAELENRIALTAQNKIYVVYGYGYVNNNPGSSSVAYGKFGLYIIDPKTDQVAGSIPFSVPLQYRLFPF